MHDNCNPKDCPMLPRVEALEEANKTHGRTHEGMYDRIRALETENAVQNAHWGERGQQAGRSDRHGPGFDRQGGEAVG